jgi:uncharacterized membrane protein
MFDDAGPGMIEDPVSILAYLAAVVGVVFQLGRLEALRPLFDRLPPLVWAYFLPMGYAGFYLLLASVGAQADLRKVVSYPQFVLLGVLVIAVYAAVAVLGNVLGTYLGLLVAQLLAGVAA